MPDQLTCFACEREPTQQCPRCGRPYCDEHGEELCDACLEPASGVPSFTLYRGSLLALLVGTALAVYLLIQPSSGDEGSGFQPVVVTPTTTAAANQTPAAGQTPSGTTTPGAATSPTATRTGTPVSGTPPPSGTKEYTVVSGDTLSAICERQKPASMTVPDCVERVVALNSLANANDISVGQKLLVPQ